MPHDLSGRSALRCALATVAAYSDCVPSADVIQVIAHRGANDEEPEHSLAAYLKAVEQGADAIECDVRLTVDGSLVCVHDRRVDRTSSGRGAVSAKTLGQLSAYDFSGGPDSWIDFEEPPADETRTSVLTLKTLLATMLDASPTIEFAIETKHPTRYGRYVEEALVDMLRHYGLVRPGPSGAPRARVMSFSRSAIGRVRELSPTTPTVLLMEDVRRKRRDGSLPKGVSGSGPSIEIVRAHPKYVAKVHEHGGFVHVWTVDKRADLELCLELGVDAVITNRPGRIREMLSR
jgi:glycerophosphoryl diester phosphodiesterase